MTSVIIYSLNKYQISYKTITLDRTSLKKKSEHRIRLKMFFFYIYIYNTAFCNDVKYPGKKIIKRKQKSIILKLKQNI